MSRPLSPRDKVAPQPRRAAELRAQPMWQRRHSLMQDIEGVVRAVVLEHRMLPEIAEQIAVAVAGELADEWAGQNITFPVDYHYRVAARDLEIYAAHRAGTTVPALADRYRIGERAVRKCLARVKRHAESHQQDLFGPAA